MRYIIVLILLFLPFVTFAQGGSNYSIIGIGNINYYGNSAYAGMGGTTIAMPIKNGINMRNPALWSMVDNSRLQTGYRFNQNYISNENTDLFQNNGNVNGFSVLMSIDTSRGISAALGLVPYSNVNYFTASPFTVTEQDVTITGKTEYKGSGGLNMGYFGASTKIIDNLYVGASAFVTFGVINSQVDNLVFGEISNFSFNTRVMSRYYTRGWGVKTGMYYKVSDGLSIGAFYERMNQLSVSDSTIYFRPSSVGITHFETDEFDIDVPDMYGFGLSYKTGKFLLGADVGLQDFSGFAFNEAANTEFDQSMHINFGGVRLGNNDYDADYSDKISYRFGFSYKDLYYQVMNEQITDLSVSVGFGMPIPKVMQIDLGFTLGARGTTSNGLVREYYGQLNFDLSIGEIWFNPFEREFE